MEKVVYALGLDSSFGTYFTDFILSGLCLLYFCAMLSFTLQIRSKMKGTEWNYSRLNHSDDKAKICSLLQMGYAQVRDFHTQTLSFSAALLCCALMHLAGGIAHIKVTEFRAPSQTCLFMTSPDSDYDIMAIECFRSMLKPLLPLYIIWQIANFFACLFADTILLLTPYAVIEFFNRSQVVGVKEKGTRTNHRGNEEKKGRLTMNNRKFLLIFVTSVAIVVFVQLVYYTSNVLTYLGQLERNFMPENVTSLTHNGVDSSSLINLNHADLNEALAVFWSTQPAAMTLFFVFFIYSITSTILAVLQTSLNKSRTLQDQHSSTQRLTTGTNSTLPSNSSRILGTFSHKTRSQFRLKYVHTLRSFGSWTIFMSGMIQYTYSSECGTNDSTSCPFPNTFNHNAVYHSLTAFGVSAWFVAEYKNCNDQVAAISGTVKTKNP